MKRVFRAIQFAANIAILILTPLVGTIVIRDLIYDSPTRQDTAGLTSQFTPKRSVTKPSADDLLGKVVPLDGVNWKDNQKTLVLYLSTTCRYCNASIPFYQRLLKERPKDIRVVALFSQSEAEAATYLNDKKIKVDEVRNESLGSIGVTGTPTILLVNQNGVITNSWRGKLDEGKEAELLSKLSG